MQQEYSDNYMKDLFVLCADLDAMNLLEGLFPRLSAIENTRIFSYDIRKHPNRDNGIRTDAHNFLRTFSTQYSHVLVVFDYEGSGENEMSAPDLANDIKNKIVANGWAVDNVEVICINPELENWVWVKSQKIAEVIDWQKTEDIYDWLAANGFERNADNYDKPTPPKEAFDALLEQTEVPHSAALFKELAEKASYKNCIEPSFIEMIDTLKLWFAEPEE
jgi:hypothetical protein